MLLRLVTVWLILRAGITADLYLVDDDSWGLAFRVQNSRNYYM